jgi:hypothetical protein
MTIIEALLNMHHPVRKPIVPHSAFVNGKKVMAHGINVVSVADNLFDHVVFKYTLYDADCRWAGEGAHELKGTAYAAWDASAEGAFVVVADALDLEFVPYSCGTFFGTGEPE